MRWISLCVALGACSNAPPPLPPPPPSDCPAVPDASHELVVEIAGRRGCTRYASMLGHGLVAGEDRIDIGTDLVFDRGPSKTPRRYLDTYPADRPFGITVTGELAIDGTIYTLFAGIGGLARDAWKQPITMTVIPGAFAYANTNTPSRPGAYVQLSRRTGELGARRHLEPRSGSVTFTVHDFATGRYAGHFDLVFADEIRVTGAFAR